MTLYVRIGIVINPGIGWIGFSTSGVCVCVRFEVFCKLSIDLLRGLQQN